MVWSVQVVQEYSDYDLVAEKLDPTDPTDRHHHIERDIRI